MDDELLDRWLVHETGLPLDLTAPKKVDWWAAISAMWPLNDVFRPNLEKIRSVKYRTRAEPAADFAIERYALDGLTDWPDVSQNAWRVLLERHLQFQRVGMANQAAGERLMIPASLSADQLLPFLLLFWLHQMKLPFPVTDQTHLELPSENVDGPISLH